MLTYFPRTVAANVYIRYKQMTEVLNLLSANKGDKRVNKVSLGIGFISAFGLTVVANFQVGTMRHFRSFS